MHMKKNLSLAGLGLAAMGLFMGSCVSKRKYMEAQSSAAARYTADSTQWATSSATMQQNITSLEQKNTDYQKQMDSFRTASANYQKQWEPFQSTYATQNTSTEQLHQQIHTAIDQYVEASNVESKNGRVYINLPEKMLFTSGGSTLSSKGKEALDKLAEVLASNNNVEVDIITTAAYYSAGTGTASMTSETGNTTTDKNVATSDNQSRTDDNAAKKADADKTTDKTDADKTTDKTTESTKANVGDSAYPGSGTKTAKTKQDPAKKSTATKSTATKSSTAKKSTATASNKSQGDKSVSFKSTPKKSTKAKTSTAPSWNLNVARSTAIVRQLTQNGLPQARIVLTGQNSKGVTTNEWASTNKGYQIVVSPKLDTYYQMMQERQAGQGTTSMK
jgi:outer membrane protein OmpA-like peptidoglycan-associated protein